MHRSSARERTKLQHGTLKQLRALNMTFRTSIAVCGRESQISFQFCASSEVPVGHSVFAAVRYDCLACAERINLLLLDMDRRIGAATVGRLV